MKPRIMYIERKIGVDGVARVTAALTSSNHAQNVQFNRRARRGAETQRNACT